MRVPSLDVLLGGQREIDVEIDLAELLDRGRLTRLLLTEIVGGHAQHHQAAIAIAFPDFLETLILIGKTAKGRGVDHQHRLAGKTRHRQRFSLDRGELDVVDRQRRCRRRQDQADQTRPSRDHAADRSNHRRPSHSGQHTAEDTTSRPPVRILAKNRTSVAWSLTSPVVPCRLFSTQLRTGATSGGWAGKGLEPNQPDPILL